MVRVARRKSVSGIYHIMLRGINRQTIFEEDADKYRFLRTIERYKQKSGFKLYAYCLMDNHIHMLMQEMEETVSETIKRIGSSYVYWYNSKYERRGHLFQGRFRSENVETDDYFKTVLRYIHQNPVRANLMTSIFECEWTSLGEYLGRQHIIDIDRGIDLFSGNRREAMKRFIDYMQELNDDECLDDNVLIKVSDDDIRIHLKTLGIPNNSYIQQLERKSRNDVILKAKEIPGVSIRQLARVTGISKSVIDRVR